MKIEIDHKIWNAFLKYAIDVENNSIGINPDEAHLRIYCRILNAIDEGMSFQREIDDRKRLHDSAEKQCEMKKHLREIIIGEQ